MEENISQQSENTQTSPSALSNSDLKSKLPLVSAVLLLLALVGAASFFLGKSLNKSKPPSISPPTEITPTPTSTSLQLPSEKEKLKVIILKTEYGIDNMPTPKYPQFIEVAIPPFLKDSVSAYGVGEKVLIAPKNWTGKGYIGADGNTYITLHPVNTERKGLPYVRVVEIPACVGCIYSEAAYYFEEAKKTYEREFSAPLNIPEGLEVLPLSLNLARYSLPDTPEGIKVKGVAYFKEENNQPYFTKMEIGLSKEEEDLAEFLLNTFISLNNLK